MLALIAYGNAAYLVTVNDLGDWDFNLGHLDQGQRALLKSLKKGEDGKTEVTTHDKLWLLRSIKLNQTRRIRWPVMLNLGEGC